VSHAAHVPIPVAARQAADLPVVQSRGRYLDVRALSVACESPLAVIDLASQSIHNLEGLDVEERGV
jgi:hypothetical protein